MVGLRLLLRDLLAYEIGLNGLMAVIDSLVVSLSNDGAVNAGSVMDGTSLAVESPLLMVSLFGSSDGSVVDLVESNEKLFNADIMESTPVPLSDSGMENVGRPMERGSGSVSSSSWVFPGSTEVIPLDC